MDELKLGAILVGCVLAGGLAACGTAPRNGTLGAHMGPVKVSLGLPLNAGRELTLTEIAVTYGDGRGITIESVRPLALRGPALYLGTALLLPPRQGFEASTSGHFPSIGLRATWARLPYTTRTKTSALNLGVGFALRGPGVTQFAGLAVRYRQHGREYVATVPLGARICVPSRRWSGRCASVPTAQIPRGSIRPA